MSLARISHTLTSSAAVVCGFALAAGPVCPSAEAASDAIIWEGNDQAVALVSQDEDAAPPNDHPATVAPEDIARMLGSLRFRFSDQESNTPPTAVFNEEQIEILGPALATGLRRATPSQDVTFSIIGAHRLSPDAIVRRNRLTAGRVFFRQDKLNVIFGEIQSPYRKKNIYGRVEQDFYPREYGSRAAPDEQESLLMASTAASLRDDADGPRHDWVVIDPGAAVALPEPSADVEAEGPVPAPGSAAPAPAVPAAAGVTEAESPQSAEQRLETLKQLREKDLISEEAYREKVDEILEEL